MRLRGDAGVLRELERLIDPGTVAGLTESELVARFVDRRDPVAFEAIVSRHGPMVLSVCRVMLADSNDVDDAFQATFAILIEKAKGLRHPERLGPWLHGVAYRVAHRARTRRRPSSIPEDLVGRACEDQSEKREEIAALHDEIDRLPEKYRLPVVLCCLEEQSGEQAARRLGWPVGTVHGRLSRARDMLRDRLSRHGRRQVHSSLSLGLPVLGAAKSVVPEQLVRATLGLLSRTVPVRVQTLIAGVLSAMLLEKMKALGVASAVAISVVTTVSCLVVFPPQSPRLRAQVAAAADAGTPGKPTAPQHANLKESEKADRRLPSEPLSDDAVQTFKPDDGEAVKGAGVLQAKIELLELESTIIRNAIQQTKSFLVGVDTEGLEEALNNPNSNPNTKQSAEVSLANVRSSAAHLERLKKDYMITREKIATMKAKRASARGMGESTDHDTFGGGASQMHQEAQDLHLGRLRSELDLLELESEHHRDVIKKTMAWLGSTFDNRAAADFGNDLAAEKKDADPSHDLRRNQQQKLENATKRFKNARERISVLKSQLARESGSERTLEEGATGESAPDIGHRLQRLEKKVDDITAALSRSSDRRKPQ